MIRLLWLALLLAPCTSALTLQQALEQGLAGHALLEAAGARIQSAESLRQQAALKPNTRLFLQSENSRLWSTPGFVYARDADSFLYASQVIETGSKRTYRTAAATAAVQRTVAERGALRWQLSRAIASAYWSAAGAARVRDSALESLNNFELTVRYHQDRVKEGAMAEVDLLRVQLESERLRNAFRIAEQEAVTARIRLFREMGLADEPTTVFSDPLEQFPVITLPSSSVERPDLRVFAESVHQANANLRLQLANARPDPELLAGYKRTNGYDTLIAGVQINLPFRNRNQGNIAAAQADRLAADATQRAAQRAAQADVTSAFATYQARRALVTSTLPALRERAREIARISGAAYREGGTDLLRLLDAERARIDADLVYFRAVTDFQLAVVELQSALGLLQ